MSDIEQRLREMLERRAQDIEPDREGSGLPDLRMLTHEPHPSEVVDGDAGPTTDPPIRPLTLALSVAAALFLLTGGLLFATNMGDDTSATAGSQQISTEQEVEESDIEEGVEGEQGEGAADGEPAEDESTGEPSSEEIPDGSMPTIEEFAALFPEAVDLESGSTVYADYGEVTADGQVASYLADRLPDLAYTAQLVDVDGLLTLFRWSVSQADIDETGFVLVRGEEEYFRIVAATTDGIELPDAERSLDGIRVVLTDTRTEDLVVDVTSLYGEPIPSSPNPDGIGPPEVPVLGTAGVTDGDRIELELATGSRPVVVKAQNVGGTMLTIMEFPLDSVGFPTTCGAEPPLKIDVGSLLGPLEDGPAPQTLTPPLVNQQIWHYPGAEASIEVRWPADPAIAGRADLSIADGSTVLSFLRSTVVPDGDHVLAILQQSPAGAVAEDPCALLQFSVLGDPAAGEWWSTALSGQLSFGGRLTIAELDPALGPTGIGGDDEDASSDELVIDQLEVNEVPRLPATGSCDGLPDDPPRAGVGSQPPTAEPSAALAAFVDGPGQTMDPPFGVTGYTELSIDENNISYVYPVNNPVVVINVEQVADGWQVTTWEASPC